MALLGANNLPQITHSAYTSTAYSGLPHGSIGIGALNQGAAQQQSMAQAFNPQNQEMNSVTLVELIKHKTETEIRQQAKEHKMAEPKRRLIKVIIIDPDEKVPLDKCILHSGTEKLTDLTDQELFFEIDIKYILDEHNEARKKIIDKSVKERTEFLEPIKVRDLRMVVVTVAQF